MSWLTLCPVLQVGWAECLVPYLSDFCLSTLLLLSLLKCSFPGTGICWSSWYGEGRLELLEGRVVWGMWTKEFFCPVHVTKVKCSLLVYRNYLKLRILLGGVFKGFCRGLLGASVLREGVLRTCWLLVLPVDCFSPTGEWSTGVACCI